MKQIRSICLCLLALTLCLTAIQENSRAESKPRLYELGDVIEDFNVITPEGDIITLESLLETYKAVVINFWFVDCVWCVYEFPFMQAAYEQAQDDIAILALTPYDGDEAIKAFKQAHGLTFMMAMDKDLLSARFGVRGYPTTAVINRYGVFSAYEVGAQPSIESFEQLYKPLLADEVEYTITITDQNGAPVPGAIITVCDETSCLPKVSDANGAITFTAAPYPYEIHVIKVPQGYEFDTELIFTLPAEGCEMNIPFTLK